MEAFVLMDIACDVSAPIAELKVPAIEANEFPLVPIKYIDAVTVCAVVPLAGVNCKLKFCVVPSLMGYIALSPGKPDPGGFGIT